MHTELTVNAFSSEQHVRQIAQRIGAMSGAIHEALRQLAQNLQHHDPSAAYALLTEEYALRARVNIMQVEAKRFARPDFPATQQDVLAVLDNIDEVLRSSRSPEELTELIVSLVLFATSIAGRNNAIIALLLDGLKQQATSDRTVA
jgi:hypothetical protein